MRGDTLAAVVLVDGGVALVGALLIGIGRQGVNSGTSAGGSGGLGFAVAGGVLMGVAAVDAMKRLGGQETF